MRKLRLAALLSLAAALVTNLGCVELDGQRLSWFYDAAKDELKILLHYDGVHESRNGGNERGAEQIPKFVESGSILVWDWPFHLDMANVRAKAADETADPQQKEWAAAILSMKVEPVGYYREPDGRVGAAQMITIPNAKKFVGLINELINAQIVENASPDGPMDRTQKRIEQAAKNGHQWITLDGHAVRVVIPVHPAEWALARGEFLEEIAEGVARVLKEDASTDDKNGYRMILGVLASGPISCIDRKDQVEFVVGWPKAPCTFRTKIRDEYEPSLEKVLIRSVKIDLDAELAEALLDEDAKPSPGVSAMLKFGPPEEQVRALLAVAGGEEEGRQKAALGRLGKFARQWNREHGQPEAPAERDDADDYLTAWRQWYEQMRVFPLKVEENVGENTETEPADAKPAEEPAEAKP